MSEKTIYLGNGRKQENKKPDEIWCKSSFCLSKIPKEHIYEYKGNKYINININIYPELNQYDKDVSVTLDTYKPEQKSEAPPEAPKEDTDSSDLPF